MQKLCSLVLFLLLFGLGASAQITVTERNDDKKEIEGFTVQLRTAPGNTYLFDILQGPVVLDPSLRNNPATSLTKGFATREDAFKVARWMIQRYKKDGHLPSVVPPHVLDELKINKSQLYQTN